MGMAATVEPRIVKGSFHAVADQSKTLDDFEMHWDLQRKARDQYEEMPRSEEREELFKKVASLPIELRILILEKLCDSTDYIRMLPAGNLYRTPHLYHAYPANTLFVTVHDIMGWRHWEERVNFLRDLALCKLCNTLAASEVYWKVVGMSRNVVELWDTTPAVVFYLMRGYLSTSGMSVHQHPHIDEVNHLYSPNKIVLNCSNRILWV